MKPIISLAAFALLAAACGAKTDAPAVTAEAGGPESPAGASSAASSSGAGGSATPAAAGGSLATAGDFASRTGEITNPDESTMVFLYHDLAGIPVPVDKWVEEDSRVKYAPAPDKAPNREVVRAEIETGAAAVAGVGLVRLTSNAGLSEYDPSYGEFQIRSLAPSSSFTFTAFGETVSVKFANGQTAQIWKVPVEESQAVRDKIPYVNAVSIDVLLKVTRVQPAQKGGAITANILEYELREDRSGATLARIKVDN